MTPEIGHLAILRDEKPNEMYLLVILSPSLRSPERWRCLVLVDDVNASDVGLIVEYNNSSLENFFERLM